MIALDRLGTAERVTAQRVFIAEDAFYADPRLAARRDGDSTSKDAASSIANGGMLRFAYDIHRSFKDKGCAMDKMRATFESVIKLPAYNIHTRRTPLHASGLILKTPTKVMGTSGRMQRVYVAAEHIPQEWIDWLKTYHGHLNPCLFSDGEVAPADPAKLASAARLIYEHIPRMQLAVRRGADFEMSFSEELQLLTSQCEEGDEE